MTDPYKGLNPQNFSKVKDILMDSMAKQPSPTPSEIALRISNEAEMSLQDARELVQEELLGAMNWLKSGDNL